jgi:hypothetical protein
MKTARTKRIAELNDSSRGLGVVSRKVVHCATLGKREHGG